MIDQHTISLIAFNLTTKKCVFAVDIAHAPPPSCMDMPGFFKVAGNYFHLAANLSLEEGYNYCHRKGLKLAPVGTIQQYLAAVEAIGEMKQSGIHVSLQSCILSHY